MPNVGAMPCSAGFGEGQEQTVLRGIHSAVVVGHGAREQTLRKSRDGQPASLLEALFEECVLHPNNNNNHNNSRQCGSLSRAPRLASGVACCTDYNAPAPVFPQRPARSGRASYTSAPLTSDRQYPNLSLAANSQHTRIPLGDRTRLADCSAPPRPLKVYGCFIYGDPAAVELAPSQSTCQAPRSRLPLETSPHPPGPHFCPASSIRLFVLQPRLPPPTLAAFCPLLSLPPLRAPLSIAPSALPSPR